MGSIGSGPRRKHHAVPGSQAIGDPEAARRAEPAVRPARCLPSVGAPDRSDRGLRGEPVSRAPELHPR
jgi:hypothetical protein